MSALDALVSVIQAAPARTEPIDAYLDALRGEVPTAARALVGALARHDLPDGDLGWRSFQEDCGSTEGTLQAFEVDVPEGFDAARSVLLGASPGGEIYFGVCWDAATARFFDIDSEEGEPMVLYDSAEAFLDRVLEEVMEGPTPLLRAIFEAVGRPLPEPPAPPAANHALVHTTEGTPPPPWAPHERALGPATRATASSAAGRRVIWHRQLAGAGIAWALKIVDADGTVRETTVSAEPYGVSMHPSDERALVSTGVPGPLLELDLETAEVTTVHEATGWASGYIDDEHVVTFTKRFGSDGHPGRIAVYRHRKGESLGEPVATLASGGNNAITATAGEGRPGRIFVTGVEGKVAVYAFDRTALTHLASLDIVDGKLFAIADVVVRGDATWLASQMGTKPVAWFRWADT